MLGARIAVLRKGAGWSQTELASRLGVSPSAVGMYEQGRREPATDILLRLSALFGVSVDYLLTGKAREPRETAVAREAMMLTLAEADRKLRKRDRTPFTREELAVLFTAMLLEG